MYVEKIKGIDLFNQRCLVMGGSGFIGTNLCLALRGKTRSLKSFSYNATSIEGVEWIKGNFLNNEDIVNAVKNVDIVFHLITTSTPASSTADPVMDAEQNIVQTIKLLEACRLNDVKKIIFVSSGGTIYGDADILPTPESYPEQPICAYGVSKLAIEKYLNLYEHLYGLKSIILRVSNPYGPYQFGEKKQGVIGTFISKSLAHEPIEIWGTGTVIRDYIYVEDVAQALMKAAIYTGDKRIFNIGSGKGVTLKDIINVISKSSGKEIVKIYKDSRVVDVQKSILDCSLAYEELNWSPKYNLDSGITKTLSWFLDKN